MPTIEPQVPFVPSVPEVPPVPTREFIITYLGHGIAICKAQWPTFAITTYRNATRFPSREAAAEAIRLQPGLANARTGILEWPLDFPASESAPTDSPSEASAKEGSPISADQQLKSQNPKSPI